MGDFGDPSNPARIVRCKLILSEIRVLAKNWMTLVTKATTIAPPLPLKRGDFGDLSDQARILSLNKTNVELNTYPGLRIGDVGDHSTNNTNEIITRGCPSP